MTMSITAARVTSTSHPRVLADQVSRTVRGRTLVDGVSLSVEAGEMVALIGGSGAGKTSLLETLIGLHAPSSGSVTVDGVDVARDRREVDVGLVPQDDIIHVDLPLRATLRYAARLRLPRTVSNTELDQVVDRVLSDLELADRADVVVRNLSGGQRKRASIAVELLTRPAVLALDEPTSGLDPATSREVLAVLRRIADAGTTVLLTTHAPDDVLSCDRVVVLAPGGRLAFDGAPEAAAPWFGVPDLGGVYAAVAAGVVDLEVDLEPEPSVAPVRDVAGLAPVRPGTTMPTMPARPTWLRQLVTLVHRGADLMVRNRLTAAILVGSPVLVIAMLATLFRRGTVVTDPVAGVQLAYWIAFAGFFFGLTYGLLQIVTETAVLRRELSWGMSLTAYVTSKLVVLLPLLVAVDISLFAVLRLLDRLPAADAGTWGQLGGVFLLDATAGLALGLLASALVTSPAQATLALPMLCFPQVLFSGAMVPVATMTGAGDAISRAMSDRWGFEAVARLLELDASDPGVRAWSGAITGGIGAHVAILVAMTVGATVATMAVLSRRTRV
jgi:ABC-type multidrug transport system ATPase subunit